VAFAAVIIVVLAVALDFVVERLAGIARSLPILQVILMTVAMVGARVLMRLRHASRQSGHAAPAMTPPTQRHQLTVLVVGLNRVAELYLQSIAELGGDRVTIAGLLGRGSQHTGRLVQMQTVLGTPEEVIQVLRERKCAASRSIAS
jgi:FlaA1/EpsC-like NDP-sugar epimerase